MKRFITYNQSIDILDSLTIKPLNTHKVFISNSLGKVLAENLVASENSPAFVTSAMDGYAFRYEDISKGRLKIIDKNPAGSVTKTEVTSGTCIKTFTGSLMPLSSDTLIPIENVTVDGEYINIDTPVPKGFATRGIGENYKKDEILIKRNTTIDYACIGVMASLNIAQVSVYQDIKIAVASTGSEILDIGQTQTNDSQIRSSNHLTMEAIAKSYGAQVLQMGVVKDDKKSIEKLIVDSLDCSDIVVTTGGVSVGDYDFVKDIIKDKLDCEVLFQGVLIKPGQHLLMAKKENKFIVALPGFAYSSTVTFFLYVLPLLFKLKGSNESLDIVDAILTKDYIKKGNKTTFVSCNLNYKDGDYYVDFDGKKEGTSAILTNMLNKSALMMIEDNKNSLNKGDKVKVIKL